MDDTLRILVVGDMKFGCEYIRRSLKKSGYSCVNIIHNASSVIQYIQKYPIDILLVDWFMFEIDGLELTQKIRDYDQNIHHYTGIVLLTSKEDSDSICKAFKQGVDDYILKPPNSVELAARVFSVGRVAKIQNKLLQHNQKLKRMLNQSKVDHITGLGLRENTYKRFGLLLKQMYSRGGSICNAILRIDGLHKIVQKYDSIIKEQIITDIANRVCNTVRPTDLVGHLESEELLIVMYSSGYNKGSCRTFKRILDNLNCRAYKTNAGFININCAIAMTFTKDNDPSIEVDEIIKKTYQYVQKSVDSGYTIVANSL
ncbi:MAG: response regulator [Gammaproteobacteria bacterium]|nr:response regulator [Gammaproteobacteria bacterium]